MARLQGTGRLTRLGLRRDRITIPLTILLVVGMIGGSAPSLVEAYPDYATQLTYVASSVTSVIGRIFQGTIQGVSLGSILTAETFMFTAVILSIMSIFIVSRHTRYNEETGAAELIGSMRVGRNSPLTSALIIAVAANIVACLLLFISLTFVPELDKTGSFFFSAALAMCGIFFAGVAAISVQLSDYRRGANMISIAVLALAFLIRAVGDALGEINADGLGVTASWITWLSPIGWANQVLPYYENRVFPLVLLLIGFLVTAGVGYVLLNHRDLGSSIIPSKPGPDRAKPSLLSAGGLARRLQRPGLIAWTLGAVLFGGMMGFIVDDFRGTFEGNEAFSEFLASTGASSYVEAMFSGMFPIIATMMAGYAVSALAKMQDEEGYGRLEYLIGTALSKPRWMMSHMKTITGGIVITLIALGFSGAIGYYIAAEVQEISFGEIVASAVVSLPAMLVFMSIILVVFALNGRFVKTFAWAFFAYCALIGSFAVIFSWPDWVLNLSPFNHTPLVPSDNVDLTPVWVMTVVAIALSGFAVAMFRRRDLILK